MTARESRARWSVLILHLLLGISLVGLPFTGGAYAKSLLKSSGSSDGAWHGMANFTLLIGSTLSALLIARILILYNRSSESQFEPNSGLILSWGSLVTLSLLSPVLIPVLLSSFMPTLSEAFSGKSPSGGLLTALASAVAVLVLKPVWTRKGDDPLIPPGDLLIPAQRLIGRTRSGSASVLEVFSREIRAWKRGMRNRLTALAVQAFARIERLRSRGYAGVGMLLLVWAAFWLLLAGGRP